MLEDVPYYNKLPKAAENEFLIEKSPPYSIGENDELERRAKLMKKANPNLKVFLILCDPVIRIYSHIEHVFRQHADFRKVLDVDAFIEILVHFGRTGKIKKIANPPKTLRKTVVKLLQFSNYTNIVRGPTG